MTIRGKNVGRIDVWPSNAIARAADTAESKFLGRMTIWRTSAEARANISLEAGGGPAELAFADFTGSGIYRVAGSPAVVGNIVVQDAGADWGAFNPGTAITSAGLAGTPVIAGALETTLLASGFTVIGTYAPGAGDNGFVQFDAYDSPVYSKEWKSTIAFDKAGGDTGSSSYVQAVESFVSFAAESGLSSIKFALSIAPGFVSLSINGGSVHTDTTVETAIYNNIGLNVVACRLETLKFHPLQADGSLPALSTP